MFKFNNSDKHNASNPRKVLVSKTKLLAITWAVIFGCIVCGTTWAFLFTRTDPLTNKFTSAKISCKVVETFDGETKSDVKIKNTGEATSYVRAAVVVTWMSEDQLKVSATKPNPETDYQISFGTSDWELAEDGFWYYTLPVEEGAETAILIENCTCTTTPPEGFYLSVEIVASAIQSSPSSVVTKYWKSGVSGLNGNKLEILK